MTKKRARVAGLAAAATVVVLSLAACSGGANAADPSGGAAADAATATSVKDFGSMDALVAAAKKEGSLNIIATPGDWANYQQIFDGFTKKYGITINPTPGQRVQPGGDRRRQEAEGPGHRSRHLRHRQLGRAGEHAVLRAVQADRLGRHPRRPEGEHRPLEGRLLRRHGRRLRRQQDQDRAEDVRRPAEARVQGRRRAERQPDAGRGRRGRRRVRRPAERRNARRPDPGHRLVLQAQGSGQLERRRRQAEHHRLGRDPGAARLVVQPEGLLDLRHHQGRRRELEVRRPPGHRVRRATTTRRSTRTRRTRPPLASGRSTSTATTLRTRG